ncbi:hypothetical protein AB0M43_05855 [Longispora sp. NPDC051575]|uniref:hypothetical protein n=1 Tax=Longispora sp. NPDC051575 TaxID=3154943 RepID=UPI00342EFAB4
MVGPSPSRPETTPGNDGADLPRGLLATDPARLAVASFGGEGVFSLARTRDGYR